VKGVAIYMEGGGDSTASKAAIRQGMGEFLSAIRDRAREHRLTWKLVACGSRNSARDAFTHAVQIQPEAFNILLVDAEGPMNGPPREHLNARDGWHLSGDEEAFHVMVQSMETWIVADVNALRQYYRQGFLGNALPAAEDLESVAKTDVARALAHATRGTQKGTYRKIGHASEILARVDPGQVMRRCGHCRRLFDLVTARLQGAR
jgi:hypothetical protein